MPDLADTLRVSEKPAVCPVCGKGSPPGTTHCPFCDYPLEPDTKSDVASFTRPLSRAPSAMRTSGSQRDTVCADTIIVLQLLPSGAVLPLRLEHPIILGRFPRPSEEHVSLADYNAHQHGVSREHLRLSRQDDHLIAADLGSFNGTLLNGEPLQAHHDYIVRHGDRLVLGTLHILITFSEPE